MRSKTVRQWMGVPAGDEPRRVVCVGQRLAGEVLCRKLTYDVEDGRRVFAWLCQPRRSAPGPRPGVLCCHGEGPGKDPLVGLFDGGECLEYHKCMALRLAGLGYVTLAPDRYGYGEGSPYPRGYPRARDLAALDEECRQRHGCSRVALDIRDAVAATTVLAQTTRVDPARLACVGVWDGAAVAAGVAAADARLRAVVLACGVSDRTAVPGSSPLGPPDGPLGMARLCALICPRPIQIQTARAAPIPLAAAQRGVSAIRRYYAARDAGDALRHHVFDGVLELDFEAAAAWLNGRLNVTPPSTRDAAPPPPGLPPEGGAPRSRPARPPSGRLLTTSDWCRAMLARETPALLFQGRTRADQAAWRRAFLRRFRDLLGRQPRRVPLRARVLERRVFERHIRERVVFDSEPCMSVPAWVCRPRVRRPDERWPAILCAHGHGPGGRSMVGLTRDGRPDYDYAKNLAVRLAEAGFVTLAPDWRGFGERCEPPETDPAPNDLCNLAHVVSGHFGYTQLGLNLWDGRCALDYLSARDDVDAARLGCVGCSLGGAMTTFLAAADPRIRAACISGYLGGTAGPLSQLATCGSQTLPGLLRWGDRAEVAGLICPRPLLVQIGRYDATFPSSDALCAYERVRRIYTAAGRADRLDLDLFEGCHEINAPPLIAWFERRLRPRHPA